MHGRDISAYELQRSRERSGGEAVIPGCYLGGLEAIGITMAGSGVGLIGGSRSTGGIHGRSRVSSRWRSLLFNRKVSLVLHIKATHEQGVDIHGRPRG